MPRKLDLSLLLQMFESEEDFNISSSEYERIVGKAMPETEDYFLYKSPVAKAAREHGYKIRLENRRIVQKNIVFERREKNQ